MIYFLAMEKELEKIKTWLGSGSINLFGRPFAGKDTQGRKLAKLFDAPLLGGGDILRGSTIPAHVKKAMHNGELIPTNDYLEIVLPYLSQKDFAGRPLILSSVGRWHGEEAGVLEATAAANHPLRAVIFLNASDDVIKRHHKTAESLGDRGQRADHDKLETRLAEFRDKTLPVIDFYRDEGLLTEVDAGLSSETVTNKILSRLAALA